MPGHVFGGCAHWGGRMAGVIEMLLVLNLIVAALAWSRVIEHDRRERDFWRAYDEGRAPHSAVAGSQGAVARQQSAVTGPWMMERRS
jgi:hypothetical protein